MSGRVRDEATGGAWAMLAYAAHETVLAGSPGWLAESASPSPIHVGFTAALLTMAPILGWLLALPVAMVVARLSLDAHVRARVSGAVVLLVIVSLHEILFLPDSSRVVVVSLILLAVGLPFVAARTPRIGEVVCDPIVAAGIAIGIPWAWSQLDHPVPSEWLTLAGWLAALPIVLHVLRLRRDGHRTAFAGAAALGLVAILPGTLTVEGEGPVAPPPPGPNVLWVVLDTVRSDRLSLYGHDVPTSPGLERFAERATVFHQTRAASNWTLPSHASMFTGLYPSSHGVHYVKGRRPARR